MYIYSTSSHNSALKIPRYTHRILGRRFALTTTAYKYLDIGISIRSMYFMKMLLGNNKGNQIILSHATWETFITKRADVEKLAVYCVCIIVVSRSGYRKTRKNM